jgi:tetratricopeptide (TPR) repeat protein
MRRYKEAKSCLDSAIAKLKEADNPLPLALAYSALSNWYLLSGQLNQAVVSLENAWETLKESSAPLDSPEAIDMQLEMAELHTRHRTPEISIQALKSLSSTVQSSETLSYAQKRNIKERIDEKLRAAEEAVASK